MTKVPANLKDDPELNTAALFNMCLGKTFQIVGIDQGLVALDVGEGVGKPSYMETIYIEADCLERIEEQ